MENNLDPITYEVLRHRMWQINDEMGSALINTAGSEQIYESKDLQVMIQNAEGEGLAVAEYIIAHCMMPEPIIKHVLTNFSENPGINDGDVFLCNDTYIGVVHPQDAVMVSPFFWEGELICWFANMIHEDDVGGPMMGSWCFNAVDFFEDPPYFPPFKIAEKGELKKDMLAVWMNNSRTPQVLDHNARSRMAAIHAGRRRMTETIEKYGVEAVKATMVKMKDSAEKMFKDRLLELPDGTWENIGYIEHTPDIYPIKVKMTKKADKLTFDFTGTSKTIVGGRNMSIHGTNAGIAMALLPALCFDIPWTVGGIWKSIEVIAEPGTLVNALPPSPTTEAICTTWQLANIITGCIGGMLANSEKFKHRANAGWCGLGGGAMWMGVNQFGMPFVGVHSVNAENGGGGAYASKDGVNTAGYVMAAAPCCGNIERYEAMQPLLYLFWKETADSGGPGKFRGGAGPETAYIQHDAQSPLLHQGSGWGLHNPQATGIGGGYAGSTMRQFIMKDMNVAELMAKGKAFRSFKELKEEAERVGGTLEVLQVTHNLVPMWNPTDVGIHVGSGGGGYGDPLDRDTWRVKQDVMDDLVSPECARDIYGVVFKSDSFEVDEAGTQSNRDRIRAERLK
ncbi:MAG: hydantoinase B/oxoprolinase family protein [Pseudomonadota bacterium]